jgi:acetyl esterase/lipase
LIATWVASVAAIAHAQEGDPPPATPPPSATLTAPATEPEERPMTPAEAELSAAEFIAWPDLRYADDADAPPEAQCIDLFTPDEPPKSPLPILVWIHGGGWQDGDKRGALEWKPARFTHDGFVLATVNYRLAPAFLYPSFMLDAARAVAWLHAHAGEFGGDPERIVLMGHSAGAHIAALLATDPHWLADALAAPGAGTPNPSPPAAQVPWLKGVVLVDGGSYDLVRRAGRQTDAENSIGLVFGRDGSLWAEASPVTHVAAGKNLPPFLLIHAGAAKATEVARRELARALRLAEVPVEQVDAPDQNHGTIVKVLGAPDDPTTANVVEFLCKVTGAPMPAPPANPKPAVKPKRHGPY